MPAVAKRRPRVSESAPRLRPPTAQLARAPEHFMALALAEARKGLGTTSPNPCVGAAIVKNGELVALGHTAPVGGPHAEIVALRAAGAKAKGADLYSTLEPCNHFGRTPPCTEAILNAGIARVFVGARDPNPHVPGAGASRLRKAGVEVVDGVLEKACTALHAAFFKHITTGRPFVTLKIAATLDGRIAASSGDSKWVTGPAARQRVHAMRAEADAVLVGAGTARADNPRLTARDVNAVRQPLRVVLDGHEPLPRSLALFRDRSARTLLATTQPRSAPKGVETLHCKQGRDGRAELDDLLRQLGELGVTQLLVEGGQKLATALIAAGQVDALALFLAPKLLGNGLAWLQTGPTQKMADALQLEDVQVELLGEDLLLTGSPRPLGAARRRGA